MTKAGLGVIASWTSFALGVASFAVGVAIIARGGNAGAEAISAGIPVLVLAEALKIAMAIFLGLQVYALSDVTGARLASLAGYAASLLMLCAGICGLGAIGLPQFRSWAGFVNPIAMASVAFSGLWVLMTIVASWPRKIFPVWSVVVGILFAFSGFALPFLPVAGLAVFVLGLLWNVALAGVMGRAKTA